VTEQVSRKIAEVAILARQVLERVAELEEMIDIEDERRLAGLPDEYDHVIS
jgi:hypothetical protein